MRRSFFFVFTFVLVSIVTSCIDRPDYVLDEPEMIDVLVDVHRAEGLLEMQQLQRVFHPDETDEYNRAVIAAVLQKHHLPRARYDSSLMWYAQHLKLLDRVYGHVEERLKEENEMWNLLVTESADFGVSQAGDSVDLWTLHRHLVLDRRLHSDVRFWEYPSDSNFVDGDVLHWRFFVHQLLPGQKLVASISLTTPVLTAEQQRALEHANKGKTVTLDDAPLGCVSHTITVSGVHEMEVRTDSVRAFGTAILGLLLLQPDSFRLTPVFVDSISLLRTHP